MIRLMCLLVLPFVLLFGMAAIVHADEISGKISSISIFEDSLVVTLEDGSDRIFNMGASGNIRLNDKLVRLSELRAGDNITISFDDKDGKLMVKEIWAER